MRWRGGSLIFHNLQIKISPTHSIAGLFLRLASTGLVGVDGGERV